MMTAACNAVGAVTYAPAATQSSCAFASLSAIFLQNQYTLARPTAKNHSIASSQLVLGITRGRRDVRQSRLQVIRYNVCIESPSQQKSSLVKVLLDCNLAARTLSYPLIYPRRMSMKQIVLAPYSREYANESSKGPRRGQSLSP